MYKITLFSEIYKVYKLCKRRILIKSELFLKDAYLYLSSFFYRFFKTFTTEYSNSKKRYYLHRCFSKTK